MQRKALNVFEQTSLTKCVKFFSIPCIHFEVLGNEQEKEKIKKEDKKQTQFDP